MFSLDMAQEIAMPDSTSMARDDRGAGVLLPPLIPDLSLLLSPWGTWLTQRLSNHTAVWLPRSLVLLLDGDGLPLDTGVAAKLTPVLALWTRCWPELVQRPRVHWFSDALDMSHAPKGEPPALLDRFDALVAALDRKMSLDQFESEPELDRLLLEGARDTLALAATLGSPQISPGEPPIILSALRHGEAEPWVCKALDRFGLMGHRLADEALRDVLAGRLLRGFARAGLAPLLGGGAPRLAAIQLATPAAVLPLPSTRATTGAAFYGEPDEDALAPALEDVDDYALWDGTVAIWYEVP